MRLSLTGRLIAVVSSAILVTLGPETAGAVRALKGIEFDTTLAAIATLLLVAISAWSLACILLSHGASKAQGLAALARLITPRFLRQALFLGAAGALAVTPVSAIHDTGRSTPTTTQSALSRSLDGLQLPDRPVGESTAAAPGGGQVTVAPGDSLWSIAASHLPVGASESETSAAMEAWYETNRELIGANPNLIFPQQQLTPPPKGSS